MLWIGPWSKSRGWDTYSPVCFRLVKARRFHVRCTLKPVSVPVRRPRPSIEYIIGLSRDRQDRLSDLVAERAMADWLEKGRHRPVSLDVDRRRKQMQDDEMLRSQFDARRDESDPEQVATLALPFSGQGPLKTDVALCESLRILRDAVSAP